MNRRNVLIAGGALAAGAGLGAVLVDVAHSRSMGDYAEAAAAARVELSAQPEIADVIRLATLAANGHNTQPWRFRRGTGRIDIVPDLDRRTSVVDPDDHHLFVSLGCAAENLSLAAAASGFAGDLHFESSDGGSLAFEFRRGSAVRSPLADAITHRRSTRSEYDGRPVAVNALKILAATNVDDVDVLLVTERRQIEQLTELVVAGNTAQMQDTAFVRELKSWMRFDPRRALATRDGLFAATSGNPVVPEWFGRLLFDIAFRIGSENDKYARHLRSSAGVAVFVGKGEAAEYWVKAGRASQRFALAATGLGLKCAFVNQPVEVTSIRRQLASHLGLNSRRPDLLMRFGYGPDTIASLRRPIERVVLPAT